MCLPRAASAEEAAVGLLLDPTATSKFQNLLLANSRCRRKVKRFQILVDWKPCLFDPCLQRIGRTCIHFQFRQP